MQKRGRGRCGGGVAGLIGLINEELGAGVTVEGGIRTPEREFKLSRNSAPITDR